MSQYTTTLTGNTSNYLCDVRRNHNLDRFEGTIFITGTFSGGTVTVSASVDEGTTKITLPDPSGSAITANTAFNINLGGNGNNSEEIKIYVTMAGAGTPNVVATLLDNR